MTYAIYKIREVLGDKIPLKLLNGVEHFLDLIRKLGQTGIPLKSSHIIIQQPIALPQVIKKLNGQVIILLSIFYGNKNPTKPSIYQLLIIVLGNGVVGGAVDGLLLLGAAVHDHVGLEGGKLGDFDRTVDERADLANCVDALFCLAALDDACETHGNLTSYQ